MSLVGVVARTFLLTFALSAPALAYSEEEGQDMFRRGLYEEAIQHWKKAAKAGDAGASYRLSVEYSNANVVKRDMQLALEYLEASVEGDDPRGLQDMGSLYDEGIFGYERNPKKAAQFYLRAAAMGNSAAMFNAAAILELGEAGVTQDRVEAYKYYVLSRDGGVLSLGGGSPDESLFPNDAGGNCRSGDARRTIFKSRQIKSHAAWAPAPLETKMMKTLTTATLFSTLMLLATPALALSEREGQDIYQRGMYLEAIEYWEKGRRRLGEITGSAYRLSEEYFDAKIVGRNIELAIQYLMQAAEKNEPRALTDLASMYDYGTGVPQDRKRAAELYLRAAKLGMPAAMFNIASMLETGEGVAQDKIEAYKFYLLSRDLGFAPFARKALEELGNMMSPEQVAAAESRADNLYRA